MFFYQFMLSLKYQVAVRFDEIDAGCGDLQELKAPLKMVFNINVLLTLPYF
jgi:hypothetical protein